jgi:hypothetical protein
MVAHPSLRPAAYLQEASVNLVRLSYVSQNLSDVGELMPVETETSFARAIQDHLALKERNSDLDVPIDHYAVEDPFENHPLFKSEEQARLEETLETVPVVAVEQVVTPLPWPGEGNAEGPALDEELWGRSRDFDWGE